MRQRPSADKQAARLGASPPEETDFCPGMLKKIWRLIYHLLPPKTGCQNFRMFKSFPMMYVMRGVINTVAGLWTSFLQKKW